VRLVAWLALVALLPVAANAAAWPPGNPIVIPLCTGDGVKNAVLLGDAVPRNPSGGDEHQCLKACHSSCSRRRARG
jgi:hypothetical protein